MNEATESAPTAHYVITASLEERARYIDRGYRVSFRLAREELGAGWSLLSREERAALVVLEIDAAKHAALNANPRKERERFFYKDYVFDAKIEQVEVLEAGRLQSIVAATAPANPNTQETGGAEGVESYDLHATRADAARHMEATVRREIERHEQAIMNLKRFIEENGL
jgi:hypothetical protein